MSEKKNAGFWSRVGAFALDYLAISAYILFLVVIGWLLITTGIDQSMGWIFNQPVVYDLFAFLVLTLPVILYFAISEASHRQATLGKRRAGLRVTDLDGKRISLGRSLARSAVKFLPWQIAHTSLFHIPGWPLNTQEIPLGSTIGFGVVWLMVLVYLLTLAFDKKHRTPYDRAAGTMVGKY